MSRTLGIIGVGHVGEQVLATASLSELFNEIVLIDQRTDLARGQALDQSHALGLMRSYHQKIVAGDYADLKNADVIIITASHVYADGEIPADRQQLLLSNLAVLDDVMTNIMAVTTDPILIFVSNPVDTLVHLAIHHYNYPKNRVFGTGTTLDTSRMQVLLGNHYGIDPKSVHGYMLGEHGYTAFPALSRTTIAGAGIDEWTDLFGGTEPLSTKEIKDWVVNTAYDVFHDKNGVTNAAIARVAVELARCVVLDEKAIYPISVPVQAGLYDLSETVTMSLPAVIGRSGVERILSVQLDQEEREAFHQSAAAIQENIQLAERK